MGQKHLTFGMVMKLYALLLYVNKKTKVTPNYWSNEIQLSNILKKFTIWVVVMCFTELPIKQKLQTSMKCNHHGTIIDLDIIFRLLLKLFEVWVLTQQLSPWSWFHPAYSKPFPLAFDVPKFIPDIEITLEHTQRSTKLWVSSKYHLSSLPLPVIMGNLRFYFAKEP